MGRHTEAVPALIPDAKACDPKNLFPLRPKFPRQNCSLSFNFNDFMHFCFLNVGM